MGCSRYPRCHFTCEVEDAATTRTEIPSAKSGTAVVAGTNAGRLPNLNLSARSLYQGCSVSFLQSAALPSELLDEIAANVRQDEFLPYCTWRIDYPQERSLAVWPQSTIDVAKALLKMQLRGRLTRLSPFLEGAIRAVNDAPFNAKDISPEVLLAGWYQSAVGKNFWFDGGGVEQRFYLGFLASQLGSKLASHVIPQVHLASLIGGEADGQRVDFLVNLLEQKIVIELDDAKHGSHVEKDVARDTSLQKAGIRVVRVPYSEIGGQRGPNLESLGSILTAANNKTQHNRTDESLVAITRVAHQFQVALLLAISRGHLGCSEQPTVNVVLGSLESLGEPIIAALRASADDLCQTFQHMRKLWACGPEIWPNRFEIKVWPRSDVGEIDSRSYGVAFGEQPDTTGRFYVIQNLHFDGVLELPFETIPPRWFVAPGQAELLFFLNYIFRKPSFREGQFEALSRILQGQDTIVLLPTGAGKSVIFQLAALLLPGVTIVVAPLVSLIEDQIDNLSRHGIDRALGISQQLTRTGALIEALKGVGTGQYLFTYVSPERFQTPPFREALRQVAQSIGFNLVAIDETHCVSEWGHDFRTAYLNLGRAARAYCGTPGLVPPIVALTGTASHAVLRDVQRLLEITDHDAIITPNTFDRRNLRFSVVTCLSSEKHASMRGLLLGKIPSTLGSPPGECYLPNGTQSNAGICFCPHVKGDFGVQKISEIISAAAISNRFYAGDLEKLGQQRDWEAYKRDTMRRFKNNDVTVLVATKAAGMGLDKPNIRFTIHYGIPSSIEAYYQECGRAGRDNLPSHCFLILSVDHQVRAERLLSPGIGLEEIRRLMEQVDWNSSDDVTRAAYFHVNAFSGIDAEMVQVRSLIEKLAPLEQEKIVRVVAPDREGVGTMEKGLLRLLTLGIIADYTVDYGCREYAATLSGASREFITEKFARYVAGYNRGSVRSEVAKLQKIADIRHAEFAVQACRILLEFIYSTIEQGRRRALREMLTLGQVAASSSGEQQGIVIRQRILRYLETTYSEELEKIIQAPDEGFAEVQKLLGGFVNESGEMIGGIRSVRDAAGVRGQVVRYLESQPDHPGLLLLRAASEALCELPDEFVVLENLLAGFKAAKARQNVATEQIAEAIACALLEIHAARPAIYHSMASSVFIRLESEALARAILRRSDSASDLALEPGLYLLTRLSGQAESIFKEMN